MINHSRINNYEQRLVVMKGYEITNLINNLKYTEDGAVSNVYLDDFGNQVQYQDYFNNLLLDIGSGYHFFIKEEDKPVLEAIGHFFRSILVTCPHCGDQNEYDFTDQDVLLNTQDMCRCCDNFYLITNIESEYL